MNMDTQTLANSTAFDLFTGLDPKSVALLFDVDGTLIDIGPSPFEVEVPDELRASLVRLLELTDGATALVSGRPIVDLDRLFAPLKLPSIGGHGAETRVRADEVINSAVPLPPELLRQLALAATLDPGIDLEDKGYSFALHYRRAPHAAERLRQHVAAGRAAFPGDPTELLLGKAMFEVKRPGVSKGDSVRKLMAYPPFAGRIPVFIGDDITDESVFEALPVLGGKGFSVTRYFPGLTGTFKSPAQVRHALQRLAANGQAQPS